MKSAPYVTLFVAGDVMTGRGIDQRLAHPGDPTLYENWVKDARRYVELAEREHGRIPQPMDWTYPWGVALDELERPAPAAREGEPLGTSVDLGDDGRLHLRW